MLVPSLSKLVRVQPSQQTAKLYEEPAAYPYPTQRYIFHVLVATVRLSRNSLTKLSICHIKKYSLCLLWRKCLASLNSRKANGAAINLPSRALKDPIF